MQPSNISAFFSSGHTLSYTQRGKFRISTLKSPSKLWVDKPGHKPFCAFLNLLTWEEPFGNWYWRKTTQLTLLISCSPVSEAVISLQSAWSAGLGKPEKHQQKQGLFSICFLTARNATTWTEQTQLISKTSPPHHWTVLEAAAISRKQKVFPLCIWLYIFWLRAGRKEQSHHAPQIPDPVVNDSHLWQHFHKHLLLEPLPS